MQMQSISINMSQQRRAIYNNLKMVGLTEGGIIYGGMVRDEIIATYNKSLFDEFIKSMEPKPYNKFWDTSYHPESKKRVLIPEDMDIYFKNNDLANSFIEKLTTCANQYNGRVVVHNIPRTAGLFYVLGNNFSHKVIKIYFRIGRTITFIGHKIEVKIDLIINLTDQIIEPPFNCADFTSNLFVMENAFEGNYNIRMSLSTGTPLDDMTFVAKHRLEMKIIDDMIEGKTEFIRNVEHHNSEFINGSRILKMLIKPINNYQITNLLFREIQLSHSTQTCDICLDLISVDSRGPFIEIMTNKHASNVMHKKCFIGYLTKEIANKYRNNESGQIECRCTRRNPFNFKNSYNFSSVYK